MCNRIIEVVVCCISILIEDLYLFMYLKIICYILVSGVFHRDDCIQHVHTQMINWHGPTGTIFSVDIQPQRDNSRQRVATGGADSRVQVCVYI